MAETTEVKETKEPFFLKAKFWSLIGKIIGLVVIVGGHVLKGFNKLPGLTSKEICVCGICCWAVFAGVDVNILVDKFTK